MQDGKEMKEVILRLKVRYDETRRPEYLPEHPFAWRAGDFARVMRDSDTMPNPTVDVITVRAVSVRKWPSKPDVS